MKRLSIIIDDTKTLTADIAHRMKEFDMMAESSNTKTMITSFCNKLTRCEKKVMQEVDPERKQILLDQVEDLKAAEELTCEEMIGHAKNTQLGDYTLLVGGLCPFQKALNGLGNAYSKRAQIDLEYALQRCIESFASGKLNPKNRGMEQTNRKGMMGLQNAKKMPCALREIYPPDSDFRKRLDEDTLKWKQLSAVIFDVE